MSNEEINYSYLVFKTRPSPLDDRDWIAENIHPKSNEIKLPIVLDYRFNQLPIRNQGKQGSCAAFAACVMKEWQELKNINFKEYMSPQFIYNLRKNQENEENEGMFGRELMKIIQKIGSIEEVKYKYGKIEKTEFINKYVYDRAKNYCIKGYAKVETIEGLKVALKKNGPCYISFPVYNYGKEFWHSESDDELWWGGHALAVVAYDTKGFWLKNSWGIKWNGNGYTRYPFTHWGKHWEIFTIIDNTSSIISDNERLENNKEQEECKKIEEKERKNLEQKEKLRKFEETERKRFEKEEELQKLEELRRLEEKELQRLEEEERKRLEKEEELRKLEEVGCKKIEEEEEEAEEKEKEEEESQRLEKEQCKRLEKGQRTRLEKEKELRKLEKECNELEEILQKLEENLKENKKTNKKSKFKWKLCSKFKWCTKKKNKNFTC